MKLWAATGLSTILGVLSPSGKVVILLLKLGKEQTTVSGRIGAEMEWYSTACGTVLLSHATKETKRNIIGSTLYKRFTEKTVIEPEKLRIRLESCQEEKTFLVDGENHINHCDIASPILDSTGRCIAAISCIFEKNTNSPDLEYVKAALLSAAEAISAQLGYFVSSDDSKTNKL